MENRLNKELIEQEKNLHKMMVENNCLESKIAITRKKIDELTEEMICDTISQIPCDVEKISNKQWNWLIYRGKYGYQFNKIYKKFLDKLLKPFCLKTFGVDLSNDNHKTRLRLPDSKGIKNGEFIPYNSNRLKKIIKLLRRYYRGNINFIVSTSDSIQDRVLLYSDGRVKTNLISEKTFDSFDEFVDWYKNVV